MYVVVCWNLLESNSVIKAPFTIAFLHVFFHMQCTIHLYVCMHVLLKCISVCVCMYIF